MSVLTHGSSRISQFLRFLLARGLLKSLEPAAKNIKNGQLEPVWTSKLEEMWPKDGETAGKLRMNWTQHQVFREFPTPNLIRTRNPPETSTDLEDEITMRSTCGTNVVSNESWGRIRNCRNCPWVGWKNWRTPYKTTIFNATIPMVSGFDFRGLNQSVECLDIFWY